MNCLKCELKIFAHWLQKSRDTEQNRVYEKAQNGALNCRLCVPYVHGTRLEFW